MEVKTILQRFDDIAEELKRLEAELVKAITEAVKEISEENPHNINKIAPNCYVIKASQLIGKPWNPSYYDWEASGKVVLDYLQKKDVKKWKTILQEKLDKSNDNSIDFESTITINGCTWTNKTPIERSFIEKIVSKL